MKINIIIPAYNEEANISSLLAKLDSKIKIDHRIIIIDDGSCDKTLEVAKRFAKDHLDTVIISNKPHRGFTNCLRTGIRLSPDNSVIVPVMADGCDEVELIEKMYNQICLGFDIVCGSRYVSGGQIIGELSFKKKAGELSSLVLSRIKKIPCRDLTNSFKMYRKGIFESINIESKSFEISMELILKAYFKGYKITELPTIYKERTSGKSKFNLWRDSLGYLKWFFWALLQSQNRH